MHRIKTQEPIRGGHLVPPSSPQRRLAVKSNGTYYYIRERIAASLVVIVTVIVVAGARPLPVPTSHPDEDDDDDDNAVYVTM